eukprot:m.10085 g.10085  ORF g.10085 m.10085 type:complete len:211 (-) comp8106_c0_seq1:207-839(-)
MAASPPPPRPDRYSWMNEDALMSAPAKASVKDELPSFDVPDDFKISNNMMALYGGIMFTGAAGFAFLTARRSMAREMEANAAEWEAIVSRSRNVTVEMEEAFKIAKLEAEGGNIARRAFFIASAINFGVIGLTTYGIARYFDVSSIGEFKTRMREVLPSKIQWMRDWGAALKIKPRKPSPESLESFEQELSNLSSSSTAPSEPSSPSQSS